MSRLQEVALQRVAMGTIVNLTSVFEGIASMRIAQTKTQVLQSQRFFSEIWQIYSQLRVDSLFRFGRTQSEKVIDKQLFIVITSEGGFSGDIDQKLIKDMLSKYDSNKHDIIVIGHHGAVQLIQQGIAFKKYFTLTNTGKEAESRAAQGNVVNHLHGQHRLTNTSTTDDANLASLYERREEVEHLDARL